MCIDLTKVDWYLKESDATSNLMKLTFQAGGTVLYQGSSSNESGKFTWSGRSNNFTIDGLYQNKVIKITGNVGTGVCTYVIDGKTGNWKISK